MNAPAPPPRRWVIWLPLILFAAFVALREVESAMIGKPLPQFALRPATDIRPGLETADFRQGRPRLLNVFASWCVPCAVEAPQLAELARRGVPIDGVAIRDRKADVEAFLARHGNPFDRIGADDVSSVQMGIGSSGVPETFVVDGKGVIRYQHIGEIRKEHVPLLLEKLRQAE